MLLTPDDPDCLVPAPSRIAGATTGTAVVVDPQRHIDPWLHDAAQPTLHIRHLFLTHFRADLLADDSESLNARADLVRCTARVTPADLAAPHTSSTPPCGLGIRPARDRYDKQITGSLHIPLNHLRTQIEHVPRHGQVAVHCASGNGVGLRVSPVVAVVSNPMAPHG
ncbi:hypothetical protein NKDENANG_01005 [Candidatus Entotheonellaceae bacterium PAL068K]